MPNTSASSGYLQPGQAPAPSPLEGQDLNRFLQQLIVGVSGLDGTLVRPRWQTEMPIIPNEATVWAAMGVTTRPRDTYPAIVHVAGGNSGRGYDELRRHETLHTLCSFYDTGVNGQADKFCALVADGLAIPQNREVLTLNGFGLVSTGDPTAVPSLWKERWLYRADLQIIFRRQIKRTYSVYNLLSAQGEIIADNGFSEAFVVSP